MFDIHMFFQTPLFKNFFFANLFPAVPSYFLYFNLSFCFCFDRKCWVGKKKGKVGWIEVNLSRS